MKKLLLTLLCINFSSQCMLPAFPYIKKVSEGTYKPFLKGTYTQFLKNQITKKLSQECSQENIVSSIISVGGVPSHGNYKAINKSLLEFLKASFELAQVEKINLKTLDIKTNKTGLNPLEAVCLTGYSDIVSYLKNDGFAFETTENFINQIKGINTSIEGIFANNKPYYSSHLPLAYLKNQLEVLKEVGFSDQQEMVKLIFFRFNFAIQSAPSAIEIIKESIDDQEVTAENLSNEFFYKNNGNQLNMLGFSLIAGKPDLTQKLLGFGVDPEKLDEKKQTALEILQGIEVSSDQLQAITILEEFKNK